MSEPRDSCRENLHTSIVSKYIRNIIKNEETTNLLKRQVCDIKKRFHDILKFASTDEDSTCSYEMITSPVYASYLASWKYGEERRMGCPENGKDLFELQGIVEKQEANIKKLKERIMEKRNCFQILLHTMAKDKENARLLGDYLAKMDTYVSEETSGRTQKEASLIPEVHRLRSENETLKVRLEKMKEMSEARMPSMGRVYNIFSPKSVYVQSTKNVCIRRGSNDCTSSSSASTKISSSVHSSPLVVRRRTPDKTQHGISQLKMLDTERWTQTVYQRTSTGSQQTGEETRLKRTDGETLQEEIEVTTVEYQEHEMIGVRENDNKQNANGHVETSLKSQELAEESTSDRREEKMKKSSVPTPECPPVNAGPRSTPPDGCSNPESSCHGTSALLGMLFTGFCELNAMNPPISGIVDIERVPDSFLDILRRIRTLCESNYDRFFEELGVAYDDVSECSCGQDELRVLNSVLQTWLKDQTKHHDRETFPHMKMIKMLNYYKH